MNKNSTVSIESKNKMIAGLLAIFLGGLGVHKFYLNNTTAGVIMLAVFLGGWVLFGIPSIIISIIAFIEGILYMIKPDQVFNEIYVVNKKSWF
ncbi:MAG: hypothetical protein A3E21_04660 [Sulfurimonas sp. RIFCSPHIGHO2_12_FULL_36_9]|uniref:TM2 domain-containing protein n=1 Tax=Sulfurimonas sp. RIFCSPLOWO2_12_36_12 TaxID=1802253 RepID=UPI0008C7E09A|nr:TM2 domain-containing protein [Sulfurimonas sp. RIFCSPLOWO2_12_36_12]OHD97591.1 MAG: hypothetical protein A3J26_03990 [Sulfurimonas sp. RIFCSPLOWO2_02_FULL_36_28]OHD97701.1 MAG: hypothetical protein A3E21_04660 [Sulfurimonas sp. RIFCSPHIGHO2_12_FULL_36_9]OHE01857.1 MAG: hypothetical protein A2W82_08730 [Sulfurimonas sp. RIFCSPLOWO2_12_36_12]OHE04775.1 MAG: hypothetical protein A3K14_09610 [Sulfurimonas sp. RIFCSPLOWO2_12_FULL_36_74]